MSEEVKPAVPTLEGAMTPYVAYVGEWALRKRFDDVCVHCSGRGEVAELISQTVVTCPMCKGLKLAEKNFGELIALCHSELSEMLESHRKLTGEFEPDHHCPEFRNLEIEAADLVIRIMHMSAIYGWRLGAAIDAKMAFNETRPVKHGKRY